YFFAKPLRRQRLYTLADLFGERFGSVNGIIPSVFSAFIYSVPTLALQFVGMSTVFTIVYGLPTSYGVILAFVMVLGFTILGGLPSTIITDALQSIIIIVGIVMLLAASVMYGGGIGDILTTTEPQYLSPLGSQGLGEILLYALSVAPFYLVWQSTWQRIFASKTESIAKKAGITGFIACLIISFMPFAIGMIARSYVPLDMNPDLIFTYVVVKLMPSYLGGIILVALLAALLTGADSFILQGSSNLTVDLYQRLINPNADNKKMMFISRLTVVIISVLGLIVALNLKDIITMYQWALRLSGAVLVFPFLAVMFWRRVTKAGAMWSMILALVATISWPYLGIGINHAVFGFAVSFISMVGISLLTKHADSEQVKAVYWEDLRSAINRNNKQVGQEGKSGLTI
ncbi:MAG: sodium:solute symporter family protein, partial [Dehalobacterium sp.]